ncbi:MAG: nucleoside monophosphate kinase [Verrucomicrobia bacterium]|nr:nucleoside monophosphate kinase [Verrucomicrobiota bacterium]
MKRRVILLGPPGSGKGTVAAQLKKEFGHRHMSTGQLLRDEAESGSALGCHARSFLERGELVPDEVVLELVQRWMAASPGDTGFISDGFPRTLKQAELLDEWAGSQGLDIESVLFFECEESVILSRISGRRACPRCGSTFHLAHLPPKREGVCDDCETVLVQRRDDDVEVVRRRLDVYNRQTEPLVSYYWQLERLAVVDAALPYNELYAAVRAALAG